MSPTLTRRVLLTDNDFSPFIRTKSTPKNTSNQTFICLLSKPITSANTTHLLQEPAKQRDQNKQAIIGEEVTRKRLQNPHFPLENVSKTLAEPHPEDTNFQSYDIIRCAEHLTNFRQLANSHCTPQYTSCVHQPTRTHNCSSTSPNQSETSSIWSSYRHIICLPSLLHPTWSELGFLPHNFDQNESTPSTQNDPRIVPLSCLRAFTALQVDYLPSASNNLAPDSAHNYTTYFQPTESSCIPDLFATMTTNKSSPASVPTDPDPEGLVVDTTLDDNSTSGRAPAATTDSLDDEITDAVEEVFSPPAARLSTTTASELDRFVTVDEVRNRLASFGTLSPEAIDNLVATMIKEVATLPTPPPTTTKTKRKKRKKKKKKKKNSRRGGYYSDSSSSSSSSSSSDDSDGSIKFNVSFGKKQLFSPKHSSSGGNVTYRNDKTKFSFSQKIGQLNDGGLGIMGTQVTPYSGYDPLIKANYWDYDPVVKQSYCKTKVDHRLPDIDMPCHELMARPLSSKHRDIVLAKIREWPYDRQFSGQTSNQRNYLQVYTLNHFQHDLVNHAVKTGTISQFEVVHPTLGATFNVIINPYLMDPKDVTLAYKTAHATPDQNDIVNAELTSEYCSKAFKPHVITNVLLKTPHNTPGCILFSHAIWHLQHMTFELVNTTKKSLRDLKLTNYPAENVSLLVRDIMGGYQLIEMFGHIDTELLVAIARSFETGTDHRFRHFALNKTSEWKTLAKTLRYAQQNAILTYDDFLRGSQIDLHDRLMEYVDEYNGLLHSRTYEPAATPARMKPRGLSFTETDDDEASLGPSAKTLTQNPVDETKAEAARRPGGPKTPSNNDDYQKNRRLYCVNCGDTKAKCKKAQESKGTTPHCAKGIDWRSTKNSAELKVGVFLWYWCDECGSYATHKPKNHARAMERKKQAKAKKGPAALLTKPDDHSSDEEGLSADFLRSGNLFA